MICRLKTPAELQIRLWEQQLDSDSLAGKLDFLFGEIKIESQQGLLRDWPESKRDRSQPAGLGPLLCFAERCSKLGRQELQNIAE
jgi:hypothetical protein